MFIYECFCFQMTSSTSSLTPSFTRMFNGNIFQRIYKIDIVGRFSSKFLLLELYMPPTLEDPINEDKKYKVSSICTPIE